MESSLDYRHGFKSPKLTDLPIKTRINAFHEAIEMKKRGLGKMEIFERLRAHHIPIKYDTLLSWISGVRNPTRKLSLVKRFDGDLVELAALMIGDGHWGRITKDGVYLTGRVSYASKDVELARRAGKLMATVLGKASPYRPYWSQSNRVFVVECRSKDLVEVLDGAVGTKTRLAWKFRIRFLRGIYDAEGCITIRRKSGRPYPRVFLTNSNVPLVSLVRRMLKSLGIESTLELNTRAGKEKVILGRTTATRNEVYNICIGRRENVLKFAKVVGFRITRKRALLRKVQLELDANFA